ncbi:hypothetical protein TcasGA2_TC001839 [Tribolium castaneum]|uniref:CCHC-type domain-containing protein n=1 Tax=Tribolium castaneum TaxID=7070 RepID=D7EJ72_TRICA|nr:hypothetical protein TcasGA2_TC001839 [Tribolium castaneum]
METSESLFPSKDQAIVLGAVKDLKLVDYVAAIGDIVAPKNVSFASRMSNDRICIYLSNKSFVDQIISEHPAIKVKENVVNVRRLINPARRIILSNVCPSIPHPIVEEMVKRIGFTLVSKMSFLKAALNHEEYKHVLSFRRQVYVQPEDSFDLPSSLVLKYEDTNYRIFLNFDDVCFKCRQLGHFAQDCPNVSHTDVGSKRPPTDDISPIPDCVRSSDSYAEDDDDLDTPHPKKKKSCDSTESLTPTPKLLQPVRELVENAQYPLSFSELIELMEKVVGENDILNLVSKYTDDIEGLLAMLFDIFPLVEHRSMQNRIKRTRKRIKKAYEILPRDRVPAPYTGLETE